MSLLLVSTVWAEDKPAFPNYEAEAGRKKPRKVAKVVLRNGEGWFTMQIPKDWKVQEYEPQRADTSQFALELPGDNYDGFLNIVCHGIQSSPRAAPSWLRKYQRTEQYAPWQLGASPLPYSFVPKVHANEMVGDLAVYVRAKGLLFEVQIRAKTEQLILHGPDLFAAALTLDTSRPEWPPVTDEFRMIKAGTYRLAVHRDVKGPTIAYSKAIRAAQKIANRLHGRMPKPGPGEKAPLVYLHADRTLQDAIHPRIKEISGGHRLEWSGLCIFAVTQYEGEEDLPGSLSYTIGEFNVIYRWGVHVPNWLRVGERIMVANLYESGAKMPQITEQRGKWKDELELPPLPELTYEASQEDWENFYPNAFFYVLYFHAGPKPVRKAYRNYLDHIRDTCDPDAAAKKYLEPLGWDRLQADVAAFVRDQVTVAETKK